MTFEIDTLSVLVLNTGIDFVIIVDGCCCSLPITKLGQVGGHAALACGWGGSKQRRIYYHVRENVKRQSLESEMGWLRRKAWRGSWGNNVSEGSDFFMSSIWSFTLLSNPLFFGQSKHEWTFVASTEHLTYVCCLLNMVMPIYQCVCRAFEGVADLHTCSTNFARSRTLYLAGPDGYPLHGVSQLLLRRIAHVDAHRKPRRLHPARCNIEKIKQTLWVCAGQCRIHPTLVILGLASAVQWRFSAKTLQ